MGRELWEMPDGPPPRPDGVPARPDVDKWLEFRRPAEGQLSTRMVWAWIHGAWQDGCSVRAEGRTPSGWWLWVWWPSDPVWVHVAATRAWAPSPEQVAGWRASQGQPVLSREEILAVIRDEFGESEAEAD